jgi:hypothetical protein
MSQYSNAQTPTTLERATSCGGGMEGGTQPGKSGADGQTAASGGKLGAVTAGHSSKVGKTG